jgi:predicted ATP-binding protein involved in virulence
MRIEKVDVENFRLFKNETFSFHPQFNLVVGKNGKGKTSLLYLLAICASEWVDEISGWYRRSYLRPTLNALRAEVIEDAGEIRYQYADIMRIETLWQTEFGSSKCIQRYTRDKDELWDKGAVLEGWNFQKWKSEHGEKTLSMPIFAFYQCNRLWKPKERNPVESIESAMQEKYERYDGYLNFSQAYADAEQLITWLLKLNIITFQEKQEPLGWRVLQIALRQCLEDFERMDFMAKEAELIIFFRDGKRIPFKHLSDGQRTLFAMIGDIVRRAVLLNPQFGDQMLEETAGVVLIDELDLHLHPKWQRRAIEDLRRTFPKIQFICTTHSPQLIGQAKADEIILLDSPATQHPGQSYGMDSNWILRHVMGSVDRDPEVAAKLDAIFEDIEEARFEEAGKAVSELRANIGDHPELVEAEALISRYTRFSHTDKE